MQKLTITEVDGILVLTGYNHVVVLEDNILVNYDESVYARGFDDPEYYNDTAAAIMNDISKDMVIEHVFDYDDFAVVKTDQYDIRLDFSGGLSEKNAYKLKPFFTAVNRYTYQQQKEEAQTQYINHQVQRSNMNVRSKAQIVSRDRDNKKINKSLRGANILDLLKSKIGQRVAVGLGVGVLAATIVASAVSHSKKNDQPVLPVESPTSISQVVDKDPEPTPEVSDDDYITYKDLDKLLNEDEYDGVTIDYVNRCYTQKYIDCKEKYGDLIAKYAKMYGIDVDLAIAIATQERGVHSEVKDDKGGLGLFQIQIGIWDGEEVSAYNFETNQVDKEIITEKKAAQLENNIRYGMMILSTCNRQMLKNPIAAVQCYNYGYGNMVKVFRKYAISLDLEDMTDERLEEGVFSEVEKELLRDKYDTTWMDELYMTLYNKKGEQIGDKYYVTHTFSYIPKSEFNLEFRRSDGDNGNINVRNGFEYSYGINNRR